MLRAAGCYERAAASFPPALINLAHLQWHYGDKDLAKRMAGEALAANPNDPTAICNSIIYSHDEDPARVLSGLATVELRFPNDPLVLALSGDFHDRGGESATAYKYFARAIKAAGKRSPILVSAYAQGADALAKSIGGDEGRRRAVELLKEGLIRLPNNVVLLEKLREFESPASESAFAPSGAARLHTLPPRDRFDVNPYHLSASS